MLKGILDTNIVTALFKKHPKCIQKFDEYLDEHETIHLSVIVYYELYRGFLDLGSDKKLKRFREFTQSCIIIDVNQSIIEKAAECYVSLKKTGQAIQDADILIAATALVNNIGVITDNVTHFSRIKELRVDNWLA